MPDTLPTALRGPILVNCGLVYDYGNVLALNIVYMPLTGVSKWGTYIESSDYVSLWVKSYGILWGDTSLKSGEDAFRPVCDEIKANVPTLNMYYLKNGAFLASQIKTVDQSNLNINDFRYDLNLSSLSAKYIELDSYDILLDLSAP